jgi:putative ABC transport system permease protein
MLRVTLKGVRSHLLRFLLTAAAVTLGVSLVAGTYVLTDSLDKTFSDLVDQGVTGLDVSVRGQASDTETFDGAALRSPLPLTLQPTLEKVDGVARVSPDVQGIAILVGSKGTAVRNGGAPTLAFPFSADDPALKLVAGRGPANAEEVAVESSTLKLAGLKVGDTTQALIGGGPEDVTIVGEVSFDTSLAGATLVLVDPATARQRFAPDGTVPSFTLTADRGITQRQLVDRVRPVLPAKAEAVTGQTVSEETSAQIDQALGFISTFLLVFAGVSLFVGMFIIANTFSMLVAQRTRELALLRAVGASRSQVMRVVLGEAVVLGVVGSLAGLGVGIALAAGLKALMNSFGLDIAGGLPILPRTIIVSLLVGTLVTALSAVLPALRASRVAPVAALRDDVATPAGGVLRRGLIGAGLLAAGAALVVPAVTRDDVAWLMVAGGAVLIVLGALVAAPAATRPVVRLVAAPFIPIAGAIGRLARENALRSPRRTATTASALMIGLALMAGVSVIASSTKASVADLVQSQLTADFVLNGGGNAQFPAAVATTVEKLPEVASVATIGAVNATLDGEQVGAIAADATGIAQNVKVDVTSGSLQSLDSGQVLLSKSLSDDKSWKVGTKLSAGIGTLTKEPLTVGGVIEDNQVLGGPQLIVPRALYTRALPVAQQGDFLVYVKADQGADLAALRTALEKEVKPFLVVDVQDGEEFTDSQAAQINQLLYILYALLALSVLIAVLGIINTLALSVFERTREIGLLRAVGMTRRQLRRMITIESVSTAVFGALLGTVLGLAFGVTVQRGLRAEGLEVLSIPWLSLGGVLLASALAGMVAAVLPAWRAVRLDVLKAISAD